MTDIMKTILTILASFTTLLNAEIQFSHRTNSFSTHQPVLYEMALRTTGPIVEFGCGEGSTDLLHEICRQNKRLLISIDDDFEWLHKYSEKYKDDSEWHRFIFIPGKSQSDPDNPQYWIDFLNNSGFAEMGIDLCFIDQHPWLARFETAKYMKDKARFIIIHDCDYFPTNGIFGTTLIPIGNKINTIGIFDFSDMFRYFRVYFPLRPWPVWTGPPTLLGSEFEEDLPDVDFSAY